MGPAFNKNTITSLSIFFFNFQSFRVFAPEKHPKIVENRSFFGKNDPKWPLIFEAGAAHPRQNKNMQAYNVYDAECMAYLSEISY